MGGRGVGMAASLPSLDTASFKGAGPAWLRRTNPEDSRELLSERGGLSERQETSSGILVVALEMDNHVLLVGWFPRANYHFCEIRNA